MAWQENYQNNATFQEKMKENLKRGLETQKTEQKNIYNSLSQKIRSVIYHDWLEMYVCAPLPFL